MDLERALVSKIIFTGQLEKPLVRKIRPDHFADDECRDLYEYIVRFARKYNSTPSLQAAKHDKPDFEWLQVQDTLDFLIDRFAVLVKARLADSYLEELAKACDDQERVESIEVEFIEVARKLIVSVPTNGIERFSEVGKRIDAYEQRKKEGKPIGLPYGFPTLDRLTGGIQPHELVTVQAFTNVGKSTFLRALAFNLWVAGYTPLYISLEMDAEVILNILDAMAARLDYMKLKQLQLSDAHMENWRAFAEQIRDKKADIPILDTAFRITPDEVYAETLRHKPDCVILDYVGLMKSSSVSRGVNRYQQLSEITEDLKINCRVLKIPLIMAAQSRREGAKSSPDLDDIADSISVARDSDTVISLFQDADGERLKEMEITVSKTRLGPRGKFKAIWDYDQQVFREKTLKDMFSRNGATANAV